MFSSNDHLKFVFLMVWSLLGHGFALKFQGYAIPAFNCTSTSAFAQLTEEAVGGEMYEIRWI